MPPLIVFPSPDLLDRLAALGTPRLTVAEYHTMHDAGLLMEGDRVELLDGYLVEKPPRNPPHDVTLQRLTKRLIRLGLVGWEVRIQSAVSFQESEPEPDAALVRGDDTTFQGQPTRVSSSRCPIRVCCLTVGSRAECTRRSVSPRTGSSTLWMDRSKCTRPPTRLPLHPATAPKPTTTRGKMYRSSSMGRRLRPLRSLT